MAACTIRKVDACDLPRELLILADPSAAMVEEYVRRGQGFAAYEDGFVVGEMVLIKTRPHTLELVNIAVDPARHNQGIGRSLVEHAIRFARQSSADALELGTGNSSLGQLSLYQKCGFRIVGVDHDFFTRHYPERIYENGIWCRDMVRLACRLDEPIADLGQCAT